MEPFKILIGADIVPTKENYSLFCNRDIEGLCGSHLLSLLTGADYRILNLEAPIVDILTPIDKIGPCLSIPTETLKGIKELGVDFVTIANNHIMDQDEQGLSYTIELLDEYKIAHAGAGNNVQEAAVPHIFDANGKKIGIYCCAEHEFSIATEHTSGANPFDPLESLDQIYSLKQICDYVICLYHGGKEYYRYPSPLLQKTCRKIVEKGADLVVCQHSHCIGCEERYRNGVIVYGQGNFLFNRTDNVYRQTALVIELTISDVGMLIQYHPICVDGDGIALATGFKRADILSQFEERSNEIREPRFVVEQYKLFCEENSLLLLQLCGNLTNNLAVSAINKLCGGRFKKWLFKKNYNLKSMLLLKNRIECEAWHELILGIINCEEHIRKG